MNELSVFINQNLLTITVVLMAITFVVLVIAIVALVEILKLKKRYNAFTNASASDEGLEEKFKKFYETSNEINEKYDKISEAVMDINKNMDKCIQKVGIIRYNPFDEAGGNLCFAVALLDSLNNGFVLNGIHSRSGCFTYAKPIEMGVSEYVLSQEELQALNMAMEDSYTVENRQEIMNEIQQRYENEILSKREKTKKGILGKRHSKASAN